MTAESIVGIVVSFITALTAITAIIISVRQNNRSNKQELFNRRLTHKALASCIELSIECSIKKTKK